MKKHIPPLPTYRLLVLSILFLLGVAKAPPSLAPPGSIRTAAFQILDNKCNSCHRKRNPFMVFRDKNMDKRAPRIYRAVFVTRRMPKADGIPLTPSETDTLRQWLLTKIESPK